LKEGRKLSTKDWLVLVSSCCLPAARFYSRWKAVCTSWSRDVRLI